jgi:hypothetical protein
VPVLSQTSSFPLSLLLRCVDLSGGIGGTGTGGSGSAAVMGTGTGTATGGRGGTGL